MKKRAVVAIGGNSLIPDKDHMTVPDQYWSVAQTCVHIARLVERGYEVVITHGNGPQVGFILLRSELAKHAIHQVPLDSCGADTQGSIGYNIQMALGNEFKKRGLKKGIVTVVTQVIVEQDDPAFQNPTKPIGKFYNKEDADAIVNEDGWIMREDAGRGFRRVVPSPMPKEIVELDAIEQLLKAGFVVVAVGGGGIPVIKGENGEIEGVEAVIDKDHASSLLATGIGANMFLISTSIEKVAINFGKPDQVELDEVTLEEAKKYISEGHFAPGSMKPKIEAIINFLEGGGEEAIISTPESIEDALERKTGTYFRK